MRRHGHLLCPAGGVDGGQGPPERQDRLPRRDHRGLPRPPRPAVDHSRAQPVRRNGHTLHNLRRTKKGGDAANPCSFYYLTNVGK